jgi:hypothetical protein
MKVNFMIIVIMNFSRILSNLDATSEYLKIIRFWSSLNLKCERCTKSRESYPFQKELPDSFIYGRMDFSSPSNPAVGSRRFKGACSSHSSALRSDCRMEHGDTAGKLPRDDGIRREDLSHLGFYWVSLHWEVDVMLSTSWTSFRNNCYVS